MRKNNKGLTLIELVVTIAIIAIFSGVVVSLIGLGSNTYRATSGNAKIQMETQEAADQIQNLIIDANRSVYYAECSVDGGYSFTLGNQIQSDVQESSGGRTGTVSKAFVVCNEQKEGNIITYQYDVIVWDANSHKIIYTSKEATAIAPTEDNSESGEGAGEPASANAASDFAFSENDATGDGENQANGIMPFSDEESEGGQGTSKIMDSKVVVAPAVLAEDITDFCADTTLVLSDQIVRFQLFTEKSGKKINVLNTVNLRNPIKVSAPDESFGSAAAVDGKISILVPSKPLKPGDVYTFSTYTVGDVDPTTIRWYSKDPDTGFFQSSDLTLGKIFISEDPASNTLTIYVKAKTSSGREITSNEVTITIEKPAAEVTGIEPSQDTVVLAVNATENVSYDLDDIISWTEILSDNEEGEKISSSDITWSCDGANGISVNSDGTVNVSSSAGTDTSDSVFNVQAVYTGEAGSFTGSVTVKLARLEIKTPAGEYKIDDQKPQIETEYKVGGGAPIVKNDKIKIKGVTKQTNSGTMSYEVGAKFTADEVGSWDIIVETAIEGTIGTAVAKGSFTVKLLEKNADIVLSSNGDNESYDMLFAGGTYVCSYYKPVGFHLGGIDTAPGGNYSIKWTVSGEDGKVYFQENQNSVIVMGQGAGYGKNFGGNIENHDVHLVVKEGADGFIINAEMVLYSDPGDEVMIKYVDSKEVKVANEIDIVHPDNASMPKNGATCNMETSITVSNSKGEKNYLTNHGADLVWSKVKEVPDNARVNIDSSGSFQVPDNLQSLTVKVETNHSTMIANGGYPGGKLTSAPFEITIVQPEYTIEIYDKNNPSSTSTEIFADEKVNLLAQVKMDGDNINVASDKISWSCTDEEGNSVDTLQGQNGNEQTFSVEKLSSKIGIYTVTATYTPPRNDAVKCTISYTIEVKDHVAVLTLLDINGQSSGEILENDSIVVNAELSLDGNVVDSNIASKLQWSCQGPDKDYTYNVLSDGGTEWSKKFNMQDWTPLGQYVITASYTTVGGTTVSARYTLNVVDHKVEIKVLDDEQNKKGRIFVDESIIIHADLFLDDSKVTDDNAEASRIQWSCTGPNNVNLTQPDSNPWKRQIGNIPSGEYTITATYRTTRGTETSASYTLTVKPYTPTAKIVVVNNKTSVLPQEKTSLWLDLRNEKGAISVNNVNWVVRNPRGNLSSYSTGSGEENMIQFSSGTPGTYTVTATVTYQDSSDNWKTYSFTESVDIVVGSLKMELFPTATEFHYGSDPGSITAKVYNAQSSGSNVDVTNSYEYCWSVSPSKDYFTLAKQPETHGNVASFSVNTTIPSMETVTITAKAVGDGSIVATASVDITLNIKPTVAITYQCNANSTQNLRFEDDDGNSKILKKQVYVKSKNSNTPVEQKDWTNIPTLSSFDENNLQVIMGNGEDFDNYDYVMISVELESKIYNFYIYSVKFNVYNGEHGQDNLEAIAYVPGDIDTIRKLASLAPAYNDKSYGFIYQDTVNTGGKECEIRYSIHSCTGIGSFGSENSYGKWFMKMDGHYYRYEENGWYLFHDGLLTGWNPFKKAQKTHYYWGLNEDILLLSEWGSGNITVPNTIFWQTWN